MLNTSLNDEKAGEEHLEEVPNEGKSKTLLSSASVPFYTHSQGYSQHAAPLPHSGADLRDAGAAEPSILRKSEWFGLIFS